MLEDIDAFLECNNVIPFPSSNEENVDDILYEILNVSPAPISIPLDVPVAFTNNAEQFFSLLRVALNRGACFSRTLQISEKEELAKPEL